MLESRPCECSRSLSPALPGPRILATRVLLSCGLLAVAASLATPAAADSDQRITPVVRAVEECGPSVVNIQGQKSVPSNDVTHPGAMRQVNGMGTGVVIDSRGYILTNHHVVDGVRQINVTLSGGQSYIATLVARDAETDLAVIRIRTPGDLPVIRLGSSEDLLTGESVLAVGNAFGYENTVTTGVVSALHRNVQVNETQQYLDLIQTDASINPGNSGGPLLNINGEMIGVNVAVRAGAQGIGFAIPVDKALDIATKLISIERLDRNWHGMTPIAVEGHKGPVSIVKIERDSPAELSGLQSGDLLEQVGELAIERPLDVERALLGHRPGESIPVQVRRGGELVDLDLTLAALPSVASRVARNNSRVARNNAASQPAPQLNDAFDRATWEDLGMVLKAEPRATFQRRGLPFQGGMRVVRVRDGSSADEQGVLPGDMLVRVHRWYTTSEQDVRYILSRSEAMANLGEVRFDIVRGENRFFGHLALSKSETARR